jgi:hypothetical protein
MNKGFVYCLINNDHKDMVKIGRTTRSITRRLKEISRNTGVLSHFKCEYYIEVEDCKIVEKEIHYKHTNTRIKSNKEFFSGTPEDYIETFKKYGDIKKYNNHHNNTEIKTSSSLRIAQKKYYNKEEVKLRKRERNRLRYIEKNKYKNAERVNNILDNYEILTNNDKKIFNERCKYNFKLKTSNPLEDILIGFIKLISFMLIYIFIIIKNKIDIIINNITYRREKLYYMEYIDEKNYTIWNI